MAGNGKARRRFPMPRLRPPLDALRVPNEGEARRELTHGDEGGGDGACFAWCSGWRPVRVALREQPLRVMAKAKREHKGAEELGTRLK
jgi:hypothetical protein